MKQVHFLLLLFLFPVSLLAQPQQKDTVALQNDSSSIPGIDTTVKADSSLIKKDSIKPATVIPVRNILSEAVNNNPFLNISGIPSAAISKEREEVATTLIFYILLVIVLLLAFLRFFYTKYFNNLFRVFFNTSLRQSQLTDQLLQAKQVSLFFNILFIIAGGLYIYFLLAHFKKIAGTSPLIFMCITVVGLAAVYFFKYIILKFTGWLTGYKAAANTYLFIIFLINKILGILLLPFVIIIAFASPVLRYPAVLVSLLFVGLMFLLRFLRSYGLLQNQVKVSKAHFFMYIAGVELLPLLLIYKAVMVLLNKNL